ncbi:hypothetical protein ABK040_003735 [Willaertia magna]
MSAKIGKYQLYQTLGKGNFSKVKYAVDTTDGTVWAMKIVDRKMIQKENLESQLKREIAIMKLLKQKNIIKLREVLQSANNIYIVLELVTGGELFDRIVQAKRFDEPTARKYFRQLVFGIDYCHQQDVSHRDLKPENLLLDEHDTLKISDFGLSSITAGSGETQKLLMTTCGTPNYVAPEVLLEKGYDGKKADLWSCGIILYVMLSGHFPFTAENIPELFKKIKNGDYKAFPNYFSNSAKDLIAKLLIVNPNDRLTIEGVMKHEWFNVEMDESLLEDHLNLLKRDDSKISEVLTDDMIDASVTNCNDDEYQMSQSKQLGNTTTLLNAFDLASKLMAGYFNPLIGLENNLNIRRETRFIVKGDKEFTLNALQKTLENLQVKVTMNNENNKSQQTTSHHSDIKCFANVRQVGITFSLKIEGTSGGFCLVEVRRGKGSIIHFNDIYRKIVEEMKDYIVSKQQNNNNEKE